MKTVIAFIGLLALIPSTMATEAQGFSAAVVVDSSEPPKRLPSWCEMATMDNIA